MRMQPLFRRDMFQPDLGSSQDVLEWQIVPWEVMRARTGRVGGVDDAPNIVVVFVRIEGDLLFCKSAEHA